MKFLIISSALTVASGVFAAPSIQPADLVARGNCPTRQDCLCRARFNVGVEPPNQPVTVANTISGADSGLTTSDWTGTNAQLVENTCRVTVDRVCGDCSAWKIVTNHCQYDLGRFDCWKPF